jgi:hypothetical protein
VAESGALSIIDRSPARVRPAYAGLWRLGHSQPLGMLEQPRHPHLSTIRRSSSSPRDVDICRPIRLYWFAQLSIGTASPATAMLLLLCIGSSDWVQARSLRHLLFGNQCVAGAGHRITYSVRCDRWRNLSCDPCDLAGFSDRGIGRRQGRSRVCLTYPLSRSPHAAALKCWPVVCLLDCSPLCPR